MTPRAANPIPGPALTAATLATIIGLAVPTFFSSLPGYHQLRRFHPTVTLTQCENAAGIVEARARGGAVCVGGIDDADPVVGE